MIREFLTRVGYKFRFYARSVPPLGIPIRVGIDGLAKLGIIINPYYLLQEYLADCALPAGHFDAYVFGVFDSHDMTEIASLPDRIVSDASALLRRLDHGALCFGAKHEGKIIAFVWGSLHTCTVEDFELFALQLDEVYIFDTYTVPAYRGKSIAPYMRCRFARELSKRGRQVFYSRTALLNLASTKFKSKLNVQVLELSVYIRIWRLARLKVKLRDFRFREKVRS